MELKEPGFAAGSARLTIVQRARRLFTHFFDVHFIAEKGDVGDQRLQAELQFAFRFALLCADHVLVPASSYYESPMCRAVLSQFDPEMFAERISFVAGGMNLEEFIEGKYEQYPSTNGQGQIYRRAPKQSAFPWRSRARSSTKDIGAAWTTDMGKNGMESIARALGRDAPTDIERRLAEVPDRLEKTAFIASNVAWILGAGERPPLRFTNRLLGTINDYYFGSYAQDLEAAVVQDLVWLSSPRDVPSGDPAHDVRYRALHAACRKTGVLSSIINAPVSSLLSIRDDERFLLACNVAASDALAAQEYTLMTNAPPTTAVKTTVTVPQTPWETKVLIVTALPEEMAAVLATMDNYENIGVAEDSTIYRRGTYLLANGSRRSVVTATLSDMGKTNAATITANALRSFPKIEHVLMVGIAGGCPNPIRPDEHVRLGDIVVSDHHGIFEYDDVKLREGAVERRGSPQIPGNSLLQALVALRTEAGLGKRPWESIIDAALIKLAEGDDPYTRPDPTTDVLYVDEAPIEHPVDSRRRAGRPRVFGGGIATGDALVKDPALRDELRDKYDSRAIEMEGSAVRTATWAQSKDAIVVRGISDYCDGHKNDIWRFSAALAAAAYARALVETLPKEWFSSTFDT